jgi:hypothetical protein
MASLRLSEKYGLNPSVLVCFICGKDSGVALLGNNGGREAPRRMLDQRPCPECAEWMEQGVILISVREGSDEKNPHRTGGWAVVKDEAVARLFDAESAAHALRKRVAFVSDGAWKMLALPLLPEKIEASGR